MKGLLSYPTWSLLHLLLVLNLRGVNDVSVKLNYHTKYSQDIFGHPVQGLFVFLF